MTVRITSKAATCVLLQRIERFIGDDNATQKIRVGALFGLTFGGFFAAFNLLTPGMVPLGLLELSALIFFAAPAYFLATEPTDAERSSTLLVICGMAYLGSLIIFGGVKETGLYWVYVFPFVAFFLKGLHTGWKYCAAFLVLSALYLLIITPAIPVPHEYAMEVSIHFLASLFFYSLVAASFSYVQKLSDDHLLAAKEAAELAYLAKSRFLAAASHDIRQPAHALGMFVARLSKMPQDENARELVAGIDASVHALQEMLDAFFDYSKLDLDSVGMRLQPISVAHLFHQLRLCFENIALSKGLRLQVRPCAAWVQSDPDLLQRVLLNLVGNAIKYTDKGTVMVACRPTHTGNHVRIEVWDTGIGIAATELPLIFEEFYQIDNPERDRSKGLGLGLSMVKRSCSLLDHPLKVRSEFGRGTRFSVFVPTALGCVGTPLSDTPEIATSVDEFNDLYVMVIEDDPLSGQAITGLLRSWGCKVGLFNNATDACASMKQSGTPTFILGDYRLPNRENGIDTIEAIREKAGRQLPACLLSGDTDEALRQRASIHGLVLLTKPLQPAKLRSVLRRAALHR